MTNPGSGDPSLRCRRLDVALADAADVAAWSDLADRAVEPNPYYRPGFLIADATERGLPIELLIVEDDAGWLACLPVRKYRPSRVLPLPHLRNVTDEYVLLGTPLVARRSVDEAVDALLDEALRIRRAATLMIGVLPSDGPVAAAFTDRLRARRLPMIVHHTYDRAAWRRAETEPSPGPHLDHGARKELRRRARLLETDLGGELRVVSRTHDPGSIAAFLALEDMGWKAEGGTSLASRPADAAFFERACRSLAASGNLEIVALEVGGRPIAMECHLIDGGVLFSFRIAHDPAYRKGSPGTQLKARVIESLATRGFVLADSCASPENIHMNRLWPDRRPMSMLVLPTGARTSGLVRPAIAGRGLAKTLRDEVLRHRRRTAHASS